MAQKDYFFDGVMYWLKDDKKFNRYTVDMYLDPASWKKFNDSGLQNTVRQTEAGDMQGKDYVRFARRKQKIVKGSLKEFPAPLILDQEGEPIEIKDWTKHNIGNGSNVTVKVRVFDTIKGKGSDLLAIRVNDLKEFTPAPAIEVDESEKSPF